MAVHGLQNTTTESRSTTCGTMLIILRRVLFWYVVSCCISSNRMFYSKTISHQIKHASDVSGSQGEGGTSVVEAVFLT